MFSGPPSCGKTSTVELLRGCDSKVTFRDQITAGGLKSDYVDPKSGKTPKGLLYMLDNRCLVIKELASLFALHPNALKSFIGMLQAPYDSRFDSQSGTVGHQSIKTRFAFLGCGTPDVFEQHLHAMNAIGPRFLYYRIPQLTLAEMRELAKQRKTVKGLEKKMAALGATVADHLKQLPSVEEAEPWPDEIDRLAEFLVQGRCTPQYLKDEDDGYKKQVVDVTIEDPTRLTTQLYTLGLCLARLRGESKIADQDIGLLMQVVISTLPYARWKVLEAIAAEEKDAKDDEDSEDSQDFLKQRVKFSLGLRAGIPDAAAIPGERGNPVITALSGLLFRKPPCDNTPLMGTRGCVHEGGPCQLLLPKHASISPPMRFSAWFEVALPTSRLPARARWTFR
jgi:hypothetical protein